MLRKWGLLLGCEGDFALLLHEGLGKCRQVRLGKRTETVKDRIGGFTGKCEGRMYFWPSGMLCRSLGRSFLKKSVSGQSRLLDLQREVSEILQQKLLKESELSWVWESPYRAE